MYALVCGNESEGLGGKDFIGVLITMDMEMGAGKKVIQ